MSTDSLTMGKRIAQLRKEKGMTQEQLAEKLGVSAQAVSKWENDVSCPDITLFPLLASTLGVTTDELLGIDPIEPHVVVVDKGKNEKKDWTFDIGHTGKHSGIIFGCMLLLLGLIYLLHRLVPDLPIKTEGNFWWILLCLTMLGTGIGSFRHKFSFGGLALILFSGYLFYVKIISTTAPFAFDIVWPLAIVLIAVGILVEILTKRQRSRRRHRCHGSDKTPSVEYTDSEGHVSMDCAFCDEKRIVTGELKSVNADVSFGSFELDVSDCTISDGCIVNVDVSFGSMVLYVSNDVNIVKSMDNSFGSTTVHGNATDGKTTLYIKGDVSFGSVDIKRK